MPIDLETPEAFLFQFTDSGGTYAVSVWGRTEGEARHRFAMMSVAEKRRSVVARIERHDSDLIADFARWIAAVARLAASRLAAGRRPA